MTENPRPTPAAGPWRLALRLLAYPVVCYVAVIIVLMVFETRMIFLPTPASTHWQLPPPEAEVQDVWLQTDDGRMHAWWFPRAGAEGAVLFCHGNDGNLSHCGPMAVGLMEGLSESVLIVDYPGYGKSEGAPTEAGCYAAAAAAYDWLTQTQKIAPERLILFGESLGGGVATDLASRRPHRALVLSRTFTSVADVAQGRLPYLPAYWLVRNRFDSVAKISRCQSPIFVAHGDRDGIVPFPLGKRLFEAAPEPKRFLLFPGGDHNDPYPPNFYSALTEFLEETAKDNQ